MEREQAVKILVGIRDVDDTEHAHIVADDVLCNLLLSLGYLDVVEEYAKVGKWYA